MTFEEFRKKLQKIGLENQQVSEVVEAVCEGLEITIQPRGFVFESGKTSIKFLNTDGSPSDGTQPIREKR